MNLQGLAGSLESAQLGPAWLKPSKRSHLMAKHIVIEEQHCGTAPLGQQSHDAKDSVAMSIAALALAVGYGLKSAILV